jgi:hypothetical protein
VAAGGGGYWGGKEQQVLVAQDVYGPLRNHGVWRVSASLGASGHVLCVVTYGARGGGVSWRGGAGGGGGGLNWSADEQVRLLCTT